MTNPEEEGEAPHPHMHCWRCEKSFAYKDLVLFTAPLPAHLRPTVEEGQYQPHIGLAYLCEACVTYGLRQTRDDLQSFIDDIRKDETADEPTEPALGSLDASAQPQSMGEESTLHERVEHT